MIESMLKSMRTAERLRQEILRTGIRDVGLRSVDGVLEPVYFVPPTDADRRTIEALFASFDPRDAAAQEAWEAEQRTAADLASIDDGTPTPAALLAVALESGRGGTDEAIKARAKQRITEGRAAGPAVDPAAVRGGRP